MLSVVLLEELYSQFLISPLFLAYFRYFLLCCILNCVFCPVFQLRVRLFRQGNDMMAEVGFSGRPDVKVQGKPVNPYMVIYYSLLCNRSRLYSSSNAVFL